MGDNKKQLAAARAKEKKAAAATKKLLARVKKLERGTSKTAKDAADGAKKSINTLSEAIDALAKPTEEVLQGFTALVASSAEFQKQNQKFFQAGYTGQMFSFSDAISTANKASLDLNGNLSAGATVATAFRDKTMAVAVASKGLTDALMTSGVALQGAGFDMNTFAEIVDSAAFAFNKNESGIKGLTATLINVQREIPVSGRVLADNFRFAQKNFAYSSGKMMDNFIGLQKMSVTTGVSFEGLTTAFGSSMDTFQGSAEKAGKLNQILGKSAFNSMELLTMTETERATKIRSAIMESGRSIEDMGKFELIALQKTIGLGSMEDTRKFLRGDLKIDEKKALKEIEAKDPTSLKGKQLNATLDALRAGIDRTRPAADRFHIGLSRMSVAAARQVVNTDAATGKLKKLGLTIDQILPAFYELGLGGATMVADPHSATGLSRRDHTAIDKTVKAIEKSFPKALQPYAKIFAAAGLSNSKTAQGLLIATNKFVDAFSMGNLDKLVKSAQAQVINVYVDGKLTDSKTVTTRAETK